MVTRGLLTHYYLRHTRLVLFGFGMVLSLLLNFGEPAPNLSAFSATYNANTARAILSAGCANTAGITQGNTSTAATILQPIPDSATPREMGITFPGLDANRSFIEQVFNEGFEDVITTSGGPACGAQEKLLRYGIALRDGGSSGDTADMQRLVAAEVDPQKEQWITEICNAGSIDTTCRDRTAEKIDQMVVACASALTSSGVERPPNIENYDDLAQCAGDSQTFSDVATTECEATGGTYADGVCTPAETASSCVVDGVGWIVCPTAKFLAALVDRVYGIIESLLVIDSSMFATTGANTSTYEAWKDVRNLANGLFVVAFLAIIYSQLVGGGRR